MQLAFPQDCHTETELLSCVPCRRDCGVVPSNIRVRQSGGEVAQIWFLYDGPQPTNGKPAYRLPVTECIDKLDVFRSRFCSDLSQLPKFNISNTLGSLNGFRHTVMKLNADEAAAFGWRAGYYKLELKPHEVIERLGGPEQSQKAS